MHPGGILAIAGIGLVLAALACVAFGAWLGDALNDAFAKQMDHSWPEGRDRD